MTRPRIFALLPWLLAALPVSAAQPQPLPVTHGPKDIRAVSTWLDRNLPDLLDTYRHLHANPELSLQEVKTSAFIAERLSQLGYAVTPGVGGTGVVAVLENGPGPTVLVRGDMDALPVTEETGLPYASTVRVTRSDGSIVGVMHACGHDIHSTMLLGTAAFLQEHRSHWGGTLVLIAQPAEEIGSGARMMIEDGLFERFPRPDYCVALHVKHDMPIGHVGYTAGWAFANVDSVDITIYGVGGHGARPHDAVDPIVTAAHLITQLQTLVSRRLSPIDPGVVTVGSIHGGSKHNIIPEQVKLQLTVRSYTDKVRRTLLDGIRQMTIDTCRTFGCPRPPSVVVQDDEFTPASYNDPALAAAADQVFAAVLGADKVAEIPAEMGGEDFGMYARHLHVPGLQYRVGSVMPEALSAVEQPGAPPLPSIHSSKYAPVPEPTLRTSIETMANLCLALFSDR